MDGPEIGRAAVTETADGLHTWTFRGRGLQALASRQITLHAAAPGSTSMVHGVPLTLR
jgi:hypothetical protein